jgi:hypothetical protein
MEFTIDTIESVTEAYITTVITLQAATRITLSTYASNLLYLNIIKKWDNACRPWDK